MNEHPRDLDSIPIWVPVVLALVLLVAGAAIPLADPDLPEHLAFGEWIVRHHAVPFTEPFAWTRAGAPYYAYSWLAETLYYLLFRAGGVVALGVLHGVALATSFLAVWFLGRCARWSDWATLAIGAATIWLYLIVASHLRPQELLFTLVPLAWAFGYLILDPARGWRLATVGLVAVSAIAANVHLFFVLTALPVWLLLARPLSAPRWSRAVALVLAPIAGWLLTPYALAWPAVFRLFFGANPLLGWPPVIAELRPGAFALEGSLAIIPALLILLALPWSVAGRRTALSRGETWVYGGLWTAGVLSFAWAMRFIIVWWLTMLPLTGMVFAVIPAARTRGLRFTRVITAFIIIIVPALRLGVLRDLGARDPSVGGQEWRASPRGLPVGTAKVLEPLIAVLEREPAACGRRIMTAFDFGSYLTWRLPGYSVSEDSRGIFPDSVLLPEAYRTTNDGPPRYGAWRTADIAIIPRAYQLASVLDTAKGWRHVVDASAATRRSPAAGTRPTGAGLWVRQARDSCVSLHRRQPVQG